MEKSMSKTLKKLRILYGSSAKDFSTLLDISPSYLSEIENGKKDPSLKLLNKYSDVLDIKTSSILLLVEDSNFSNEKNMAEKVVSSVLQKLLGNLSEK